ncbi:universal stress protein [Halobacteria archaeon AArc-dxtr1]|nr:universal stress protein [Halobacteria archaeon AArc-dxtr1]
MYEEILVATDGSDVSDLAVEHGLTLADRLGAGVHALSVIPKGPHGAMKRDEMRADPETEAREAVTAVEAAAAELDVPVTGETREGVPQEAIIRYAEEAGVDAIVVGTVGRTGIDHVLLGSVAEEVIRDSPVPVLTVGADVADRRTSDR